MLLKQEEKMYLLNRLPALELSYEPKLHKKVYASAYYIIPKGPKALIWYTYWNDRNVCLLIKLNERGNYSDVQLFQTVFSNALALGTIIYGTYFLHYNRHHFTCEQLYYYKGLSVAQKPYLQLLLDMFTNEVEQVRYTADSLVVGLPVMTETYEEALEQMEQLPYKAYGVAALATSAYGAVSAPATAARALVPATAPLALVPAVSVPAARALVPVKTAPTPTALALVPAPLALALVPAPLALNLGNKAIFKVKADLAADNYQLYTAEDLFYETAMVPTYKCSVMLNTLFRKIKENANLDLLEESDDEEEFENTKIDKFVDLEKIVLMECVYSKRFKKWQPVKTVLNHLKVISLKDLQHFLKWKK